MGAMIRCISSIRPAFTGPRDQRLIGSQVITTGFHPSRTALKGDSGVKGNCAMPIGPFCSFETCLEGIKPGLA